jgi:hypothetical protein
MKVLAAILLGVMIAAAVGLITQACAYGGAWVYNRQGLYDDEISWLEGFRPVMRWDRGLAPFIAKRDRERVERALYANRIDRAVRLFRSARTRARASAGPMDQELMALGLETFRRAADRLVKHGRFSEAADWDDSMFVLAIRAPAAHHRYAALAGFQEGLDLRLRDGKPCAALARVRWAKRGLGGTVPGLSASVEEDLNIQCTQQRRARALR